MESFDLRRAVRNSKTLPPDITMPSGQQQYFQNEPFAEHSRISTRSTGSEGSSQVPGSNSSIYKLIKSLRKKHPIGLPRGGPLRIDDETGESVQDSAFSASSNRKRRGVSFTPSTLVWDAISRGLVHELEVLLCENDIDITQLSATGDSFLHRAAFEGNLEVIRTLISHGADPNQSSRDGWPPLHYALQQAHLPVVIYLIECGTNMAEYTERRVKEFKDVKELCSQVSKGEEVFV